MIIAILNADLNYALQWYDIVAESNFFTAVCGIVTLIGFFITLFIAVKTKSINKRLQEYKLSKDYDQNKESISKSLKEYQSSISNKEGDIYKIKINILNDLNVVYTLYNQLFNKSQNKNLNELIKELEKESEIDENKVIILLSKLIGYFSFKKENV